MPAVSFVGRGLAASVSGDGLKDESNRGVLRCALIWAERKVPARLDSFCPGLAVASVLRSGNA